MLICLWIYLVYIVFRLPPTGWQDDQTFLTQQLQELGPMSRPERRVLLLFSITALLWMFREDLPLGPVTIPGHQETEFRRRRETRRSAVSRLGY